jgi:spermidine/putrescine transport system substrate-binding protein
MSRRSFQQTLAAAGVSLVAAPFVSRSSWGAAEDQATYFTWGGYDVPEMVGPYVEKYGEPPNFAVFGSSEEALTKMRTGYVVDVSHPCNQAVPRWVATGLFQSIDTSKLSNWADVIPALANLQGNIADDGNPYMVPCDWGQTSITYRTDLVDLEGQEESWSLLWDERYTGRIGIIGSAADTWWCAAILAGVDFNELETEENIAKVAALLREQRPHVRLYTDDMTSLEQALASGEIVAAMTWNSSATTLKSQDVPVAFANPKEGALTWVCGAMMHKDAPHPDRALDLIDAMISVETGKWLVTENGYGHSNAKTFDEFSSDELAALGLSSTPTDILDAGKFQVPKTQEFESAINKEFEQIKAGF